MKLTFIIPTLVALIYFSVNLTGQTYRYVSNTGMSAPQHYLTLQAAVTASQPGDIIILSPSPNTYSGITIDKKVTIIGSGYRIYQNPQLSITSISHDTKIGAITINTPGEGTKIIGCTVNNIYANNVKNLEFEKCEIQLRIQLESVDSTNIVGCYFSGSNIGNANYTGNHLVINNNSNAISVINCLFGIFNNNSYGCGVPTCFDNVYVSNNSDAVFENNIFTDAVNADNSIFVNNIFLSMQDGLNSPNSSSSANNNIFSFNETLYATGNVINYGQSNIFVGFPSQGSFTFDNRFELTETSVAKNYGINGEDCGIFDGTKNYKLSGIPSRALIYEFSIPDVSPEDGQLNLILKARKE